MSSLKTHTDGVSEIPGMRLRQKRDHPWTCGLVGTELEKRTAEFANALVNAGISLGERAGEGVCLMAAAEKIRDAANVEFPTGT
jgi:hypothetical protein